MESYLAEKYGVKPIAAAGSAASAAIPGNRISMKNGERLAMVVSMGTSTGSTVSFSLKQHNAASGGTTKALASPNPYYKRAGTTPVAMTKVTPDVAADTYDLSTDFGAAEGLVVFEVLAEDLDVNNGFSYVSIDVGVSATAKTFAGIYLLGKGRVLPQYLNLI